MQTATARYLTVHPTELIQVIGETEAGRDISIYVTTKMAKDLAQAFALLPVCQHLGHAYWHVKENWPTPCSSCGKGADRSAFEPEGGWRSEQVEDEHEAHDDAAMHPKYPLCHPLLRGPREGDSLNDIEADRLSDEFH